jgi:predicted acyl esterase
MTVTEKAVGRADYTHFPVARDSMAIDWDMPIAMNEGVVLRADVFRPAKAAHIL